YLLPCWYFSRHQTQPAAYTTDCYTPSLHDALPISRRMPSMSCMASTNFADMWFRERSENTTEYSTSPLGSTVSSGRFIFSRVASFFHATGTDFVFRLIESSTFRLMCFSGLVHRLRKYEGKSWSSKHAERTGGSWFGT